MLEYGYDITPKYEVQQDLQNNVFADDSYLDEDFQIKEWSITGDSYCLLQNDEDSCAEVALDFIGKLKIDSDAKTGKSKTMSDFHWIMHKLLDTDNNTYNLEYF